MNPSVNTGSSDYKSGYEAGFEAQTNGHAKVYPGAFGETIPSTYWGWHDGWKAAWDAENREAVAAATIKDKAVYFNSGTTQDITGGTVEITISPCKRKLWINVDGICRLRAFNSNLVLEQR